MNRLLEIVAMAIGGLSLFTVAFVGFTALSGKDVSQVAVIGKLFPAPDEQEEAVREPAAPEEPARELGDAAVVEASLGVLSAWTLPSPYSTSELRVLTEEIKRERKELGERESALARRERALADEEQALAERGRALAELRAHVERLQEDLAARELVLSRRESAIEAGRDAGYAEVARVFAAIDDAGEAARKLQAYEPDEAATILRALGDDERASEILNAVEGARWKEYVDAFSVEKARGGGKRK